MLTLLGLRRRRLASLRGTATAAGSPIPVPAAAGLTARSAAAAPRPRPGLRMRVRGASSCGASTRQLGLAALRPIMISGLCRCRLRPRRRTLRFRRQWHLRRSAVFSTTPHVPRRHRRRRRAPQAPPRGVRWPATASTAGGPPLPDQPDAGARDPRAAVRRKGRLEKERAHSRPASPAGHDRAVLHALAYGAHRPARARHARRLAYRAGLFVFCFGVSAFANLCKFVN